MPPQALVHIEARHARLAPLGSLNRCWITGAVVPGDWSLLCAVAVGRWTHMGFKKRRSTVWRNPPL